jgi:hypothetical protein
MDMLLERERVLARLTALLQDPSTRVGCLVFLAGEAGVGKTALVAALAAAAPAGVRVRSGGSDSITTPAALGPLLEAVPELSEAVEGGRGIDRLRLFHRLRAALIPEPTLLILVDVHWADGRPWTCCASWAESAASWCRFSPSPWIAPRCRPSMP